MSGNERERWDALVAQADVWLRARNGDRLEDVAAQLIEADPLAAYGYRMRAEADLARERYPEALAAFREALQYEPQDDFILYRMAVTERLRTRYVDAEVFINRAIRIDPQYADYWVEKAEIVYWTGDGEGVRDALDHAFDLDPEHADGLHLLARLEDREADVATPEVIRHYHAALEVEPEGAYTHYNLSTAYLSRKEYDKAHAHVVEALRLDPGQTEFRGTLYEILRRRSFLYRALTAPGRWLWAMWQLFAKIPWWAWLLLVVVNAGLLMLGLAIAFTLLWAFFLWPVQKAYQWFTLGDIQAHVQEVGRRKAGPLGFHRWPFGVRMGLFLLLVGGFWYGLWRFLQTDAGTTATVWVVVVAFLLYIVLGLWAVVSDGVGWRRRRKRRKALVPEEG